MSNQIETGLNQLSVVKEILIPRDDRGRISWSQFVDDPEKTAQVILQETERFLADGSALTFKSLLANGKGDLSHGIQRYYPGGLHAVQEHFGLTTRKKRKPENFFSSPQQLKDEVIGFYNEHGVLRNIDLHQFHRDDLYRAVAKHYPGGWKQLREEMGLVAKKNTRRALGDIRNEAEEFIQKEGGLTSPLLRNKGGTGLAAVISRRYPGKIMQLRVDLGLDSGRKGNHYWRNAENVEKEAVQFYREHGTLNADNMVKSGRSDLRIAIYRYYPGGLSAIREKLSIKKDGETPVLPQQANEQLEKLMGGGK